jgi:hypothetical protein
VEQLVEICDWDEHVSIALAILAILRELHGADLESEKYRSGQKIIDGLVAKTFAKRGNHAGQN